MAKKFDMISIGDTTLDIFLELQEAKVICEHGKEDCWLCVAYAQKVPLKGMTRIPGVGNAANVAVGSSRLALKTAFYTVLGNDESGKEAILKLKAEGVYQDYVKTDKTVKTNFSAVLTYEKERTILVLHEPRNYELPALALASWVYLTSIAANHAKLHQQVVEYIEKSGAKLGFNPGTHQLEEGMAGLKPVVEKTAAFFVNREEAELLVGKNEDIKVLLKLVKDAGCTIAVITDGPKGSYTFDGTQFLFQDILDMPIVERTGCGDSYATGFMAALSLGHDISEAMRWGTTNAAFVVGKIGAQEGLLHRKDMEKVLAENPQLQPVKM